MNGTQTRTESGTELTQVRSPAVQAELTRVRGIVRREKDPLKKERFALLAGQLQNGVPAAAIARQVALISGQPAPVPGCLTDEEAGKLEPAYRAQVLGEQ